MGAACCPGLEDRPLHHPRAVWSPCPRAARPTSEGPEWDQFDHLKAGPSGGAKAHQPVQSKQQQHQQWESLPSQQQQWQDPPPTAAKRQLGQAGRGVDPPKAANGGVLPAAPRNLQPARDTAPAPAQQRRGGDVDYVASNAEQNPAVQVAAGAGATAPSHEVDPARRRKLVEIAESNYQMRRDWFVPRTVFFEYASAAAVEVAGQLPRSGQLPAVTFSGQSTADALLRLATAPSRQGLVCGLNFANGSQVGGGYKRGSLAQEEDLCRRIPNLYTSLYQAKQEGLYPFGPSTCTSPGQPARYSDVLFTPDLTLARAGEEHGFALLGPQQQAKVSLVTAAAPNVGFASEVCDAGLMYNTVKTILIAPKVLQPEVATLVLGAWGCGAFGGDPAQISELFARAILQDQLGQLYKEVHFAIPTSGSVGDNNADVFRQTLSRFKIPFREV